MTFRDDLQAWTQAQFNMLYRRRKSPIADDINKLLRDRLPKELTIKDGTAVLAEFLRTPSRFRPDVTDPTEYLEHGWLVFEDRGGGLLPYIYAWDNAGIPYLKAGSEMTVYNLVTTDGGVPSYSFSSTVTLDAARSYPSTFTTRDDGDAYHKFANNLRPELYSGLTRLLVQSLIARNRSIYELLPTSWQGYFNTTTHLRLGCIRAPDESYWLVLVKTGAIEAVKLAIQSDFADIRTRIVSDEDASFADAWALGYATLDTGSVIELIAGTNADFLQLTANGFVAWKWGWCWRYQKRGSSDEFTCGAVTTTYKGFSTTSGSGTLYSYEFVRGKLDISFVDGAPQATLTTDSVGTVLPITRAGVLQFYGIDYKTVGNLLTDPTLPTHLFPQFLDAQGPIPFLSFYGSDGDLHEIQWYANPYEIEESTSGTLSACGEGSAYNETVTETNFCSGFMLDYDPVRPLTYRGKTIDSTAQVVTCGGETIGNPIGVSNAQFLCSTCQPNTAPSGYVVMRVTTCTVSGERESITAVTDDYLESIVISDIPGCAWFSVYSDAERVDELNHESSTSRSATANQIIRRVFYNLSNVYLGECNGIISMPTGGTTVNSEGPLAAFAQLGMVINDTESAALSSDDVDVILAWPGTTLSFQPARSGYNGIRESYPMASKFDAGGISLAGRLVGGA